MNKKIIFILISVNMIIASFPVISTTSIEIIDNNHEKDLIEIRKTIEEKNAYWSANHTSISQIILDKGFIKLGCIEEEIEEENYQKISYDGTLPDEFDWRNVEGIDWTTSIKNQGRCGSCTAFATLGAVETVIQINVGQPFDCDLSEAHLFSCSGGTCANGLAISDAANFVKNYGVTDEACLPYHSYDISCSNKCPNWYQRVVKVNLSGVVTNNIKDIKNAILRYGPVVTSMKVYKDFYYYNNGIYEHVSGDFEGLHAVTIVGYNEISDYWICKNSWGTGWGENGWFKIKFEEVNIGKNTRFFSGITGNIQPFIPVNSNPSTDEINVDTNINLSWTCGDPEGDEVMYNVYLAKGNSVDSNDIIAQSINYTFIHIENLEKNSLYTWKVIAEDEYGSQHEKQWKFQTKSPNKPKISGPTNLRINREYFFTGSMADSDGRIYYWLFDWGDGTNSGWIGPYDPDINISESHIWNENGIYDIKVKYKEDGKVSEWSDPFHFTVSKEKPNNIPLVRFLEFYKNLFWLIKYLYRI